MLKQLVTEFESGGLAAALTVAEKTLREEKRYHELFEVLKMKSRNAIGMDLLQQDTQAVSEDQQRALEDDLLASCRDVGFMLLREGQVQESWVYLRHLGENQKVREELAKVPVDEENLEQIVGLLLYEGLDCEAGYALVLQHYGTCNAITTMQQALYGRSKPDRAAAGRLLVAHVHDELLENVKAHIEREENSVPDSNVLAELVEDRPFLFADGAYHIDTSHLGSTVQIASELTDAKSIELALDLARYGERLDAGLQYPGDPPFEDTYPTYGRFFAAQLGQNVDEAITAFRERAKSTDAHQQGTHPIEVYVDLLARIGKPAEAIEATVELIPAGIQTTGRAPTLYDLSEQLGDFQRYRELCSERNDLLGFVISLGK